MADLELLYFDHLGIQPHPDDVSPVLNDPSVNEISRSGEKSLGVERRCGDPGPRTATRSAQGPEGDAAAAAAAAAAVPRRGDETETSFTCKSKEEDRVYLAQASPRGSAGSDVGSSTRSSAGELRTDDYPELSTLSDDDFASDGSGKSMDYGFVIAVTCLVTGISLVAISYTVPRDVQVDPNAVSAREMERLERDNARVGAHLDRCVIAGLCLLTLGGVLLSTLLMISMWKGEMIRRKAFAYSKHAAKLYGSINLRAGSSPTRESSSHLSVGDEDVEVLS